jgi:hypothetical protein
MLPNNTYIQSIHNFIDKDSIDENEDDIAYLQNPLFDIIAVSDGAGGAGIYCKLWAIYLVNNQLDKPFNSKKNAEEWFLSISESFYKENIESISKMDPFILEKFIKEGSYATLFFAWWNKETNVLHFTGIGDTTLFVFRKEKEIYNPILLTPINEQNSLDDFPKLLNWNKKLNYDLSIKEISLQSNDIIIICTDSIARYLIYQLIILVPTEMQDLLGESIIKNIDNDKLETFKLYSNYENVSELLSKLEETLDRGLEFFKKVLDKQIKVNLLEKDDFTIVFKRI